MADVMVQGEADELAVAMVQALARQEGDRALAIGVSLRPLIQTRPGLCSRHAAWTAQAHLMRAEFDMARREIKQGIALAIEAGDTDAVPALRDLQAQITNAKMASKAAAAAPLPDTLLGRAIAAINTGETDKGMTLAKQARAAAQLVCEPRDEVFALLAMARVPGEAPVAIQAAHKVADMSQDKNLVTAVARAAKAAGVALPIHVF